jgi:DnaD/phage-associated family protein
MNLDIIDYGCVDWNTLLLVKGKQLNLTDEDIHILMLMMTCHKLNIRPITPQCLSRYSSLALSRIDEIMLKLINGHFVNRCNGQLDFKPIQMKLLDEKVEKKEDVNLVSFFEESFGRSLSVTEIGFINDFKRSGYDDEMIMDAVKEAVKANVKNFRYVERILQNWSEYGKVIKTKEEESVSSFSDEVKDFKWWG